MTGTASPRNWRTVWKTYSDPRVIGMLFLGFSAGLPLPLTGATLTFWLGEAGISATVIGYFGWLGIFYSVKVFWSPVVDRASLPWLTQSLGQRRAWMFVSQIGVMSGLYIIAFLQPQTDITLFAAMAALVAFSSATQDIAIDAYRIEAVDATLQAPMAATYQTGSRIAASLVGGAIAFYLADWVSWQFSYLLMVGCMLIGVTTVLVVREPAHRISRTTYLQEQRVINYLQRTAHIPGTWRNVAAWFIGAVICPITEFFQRNLHWAWWLLLFIAVYRITDTVLGTMASKFYVNMGYTKPEIANVIKIYGVTMTIFGAILGGAMVVRYGVMRMLLLGAVFAAVSNLLFAAHALESKDLWHLAVVISADNFASGFAGSAFIAYLSLLTNTAYTATQYALFSSLMTLFGKILSGFSGLIVDATNFFTFFVYTAAMGIPAILLVIFLMRRYDIERAAPPVNSNTT